MHAGDPHTYASSDDLDYCNEVLLMSATPTNPCRLIRGSQAMQGYIDTLTQMQAAAPSDPVETD